MTEQSHLYNIDTQRDAVEVTMWIRDDKKGQNKNVYELISILMWKIMALEYVDIDICQIPDWLMASNFIGLSKYDFQCRYTVKCEWTLNTDSVRDEIGRKAK